MIASAIEGVLWVLGGVALGGLVLLIFSRLRKLDPRSERQERQPLPKPSVGKTIHDGSVGELPSDLAGAARALIGQGKVADALGLLYRGALHALRERRSIIIEENATEGECLRIVQREAPEVIATFFASLTRAWQQTAYAHRPLEASQLRSLCDQWPEHFGGAP